MPDALRQGQSKQSPQQCTDGTYVRTYERKLTSGESLTQRIAHESDRMPATRITSHDDGPLLDELGISPAERAEVTRTGAREPINFLVRQLVYRRDRWTCQACGATPFHVDEHRRSGALHLDHIVPWSAGGLDRSDNLRTLCGECNYERSNFVRKTDKPALPIVGICAVCISPRLREPLLARPADAIDVYCGSLSHVSWTIAGAHIL